MHVRYTRRVRAEILGGSRAPAALTGKLELREWCVDGARVAWMVRDVRVIHDMFARNARKIAEQPAGQPARAARIARELQPVKILLASFWV